KQSIKAASQGIEDLLNDVDSSNHTTSTSVTRFCLNYRGNKTSSKKRCPKPRVCAVNCFVYINENGCQDCQCLWQSLSKSFKTPLLYCDLGKCNCRIGLRQDMTLSGFCEEDPNFKKHPSETEVARHPKCRFNIHIKHYKYEPPTEKRRVYKSRKCKTDIPFERYIRYT
uniref:CC domain-containing protein n=1 Tax=Angiostrongylus cantonensis TaxID=6313 RepID=A0A0K0DPS0_ANGCA